MNFLMNDTIIPCVAKKCNVSKGYGLIKIHKENNPVRPIISAINSPTYNMSKILSKFFYVHLKKLFSHINNSLELKEKIEGTIIPDGFEIVSLDVVSLFTNVPEYLICSAIEKRWTQLYNHTYLSCSEFIESIQFILQNNFFQFNDQFYKQKFGSAMGNPISPILAGIVMQDLETYALSKLCFDSIFYFRYVDDIFMRTKELD